MNEKKSFIKGATLGILATLVIVAVILGGGFYYGLIAVDLYGGANTSGSTELSSRIGSKINTIEGLLDAYYLEEYDEQQLADGIYAGMLASLGDPYTVYYNEEAYAALTESNAGVYYGIGVVVQQNTETGEIVVYYPYEDGPGAEAGILPGDIIYSVAGNLASDYTLDEVVAMIRGEENTWVEVGVLRNGSTEPVLLQVQRRKIETKTVESEILEGNIGYVQVTQFEDVTPNQFKQAMDDLKAQNIESLIIDLRDNPGGNLSAVMEMMDMMLPKGLYTYLVDKNGNREDYKGTKDAQYDYPTVVLVNGNSASASELFTGAMMDYEKATIVGTTTFGKGIVQQIYSLKDGTGIKVTMAKYYTPNGVCIHKTGITPDVEVDLDEGEYASTVSHEEDNQLQKAIEILTK
jgi:carboxyl-terminal processing protease